MRCVISNKQKKEMPVFSKHIPRLLKFVRQKDHVLQLNALRTLAFVSSNHHLHKALFQKNVLDVVIHILQYSKKLALTLCYVINWGENKSDELWEAGLVVLNQVCSQSKEDFKEKKGKHKKTNKKKKN
ncbi:hypothetical protein RFI_13101 [Reticulomyxa filosa]|uniref:Uncharacterized protein n=1 Tax=Reticulomyxa filosa TaxID=46433 RepID=X6NDT6_RETFI|nr:hypothetical protein RFI_13101 [Reticulomyxa filosa]|eukprot:ETO24058.1 hypothetical protein RFI_13101 [Reticulomyxa filosa]